MKPSKKKKKIFSNLIPVGKNEKTFPGYKFEVFPCRKIVLRKRKKLKLHKKCSTFGEGNFAVHLWWQASIFKAFGFCGKIFWSFLLQLDKNFMNFNCYSSLIKPHLHELWRDLSVGIVSEWNNSKSDIRIESDKKTRLNLIRMRPFESNTKLEKFQSMCEWMCASGEMKNLGPEIEYDLNLWLSSYCHRKLAWCGEIY